MAIHGTGEAWTEKDNTQTVCSLPSQDVIEDFAFELDVPDRGGYRVYPAVHLSRLKKVTGQRHGRHRICCMYRRE